jgi:hypothetical protein
VKVLNLQLAHWASYCQIPLLMLNFKLLDEQRTWVTPSLAHHLKRSNHQGPHPQDQMMPLRNEWDKKSCSKDLNHRTLAERILKDQEELTSKWIPSLSEHCLNIIINNAPWKEVHLCYQSSSHHTARSNDYINIQLGGKASPVYPAKYFLSLSFTYSLWIFLISNNDSVK